MRCSNGKFQTSLASPAARSTRPTSFSPEPSHRRTRRYTTCVRCCSRIEIRQKSAVSKCKDYRLLVIKEVEAGHYESASPYADSLLLNMQMEKWYRILFTHVSTLERDYLKGWKRSSKDVLPVTYPHLLTVLYASTLVGNEVPELFELSRLILKLFSKRIDAHVDMKGYTESLARKKYVSLKYVDDDIVHMYPGGMNWTVNPIERVDLVLQMCEAKRIRVDSERLRQAMVGYGAPGGTQGTGGAQAPGHARGGSSDTSSRIRLDTSYTTYTSEYEYDGGDAYGTPTSKLAKDAKKGAKKGAEKEKKGAKMGAKKDGKKKGKGEDDDGEETWRKFVQMSPAGSSQDDRGGGGAHVGWGPRPGWSPLNDSVCEPERKPGWSPPRPKFEGDSLSFGRKLDNVTGYMARKRSSE